MRITDIKADGTVYWYDRSKDWGSYLRADFTRGPIKRVGEQRFDKIGTWSASYRENPQGRYILAERVAVAGDDYQGGDQLYVQSTQVRDEYETVKARYEAAQAAKKLAAINRQKALDAENERADGLRDRLAGLGLEKLVHVRVVEGNPYRGDSPRIEVRLEGNATGLDALLSLIEGLVIR